MLKKSIQEYFISMGEIDLGFKLRIFLKMDISIGYSLKYIILNSEFV